MSLLERVQLQQHRQYYRTVSPKNNDMVARVTVKYIILHCQKPCVILSTTTTIYNESKSYNKSPCQNWISNYVFKTHTHTLFVSCMRVVPKRARGNGSQVFCYYYFLDFFNDEKPYLQHITNWDDERPNTKWGGGSRLLSSSYNYNGIIIMSSLQLL